MTRLRLIREATGLAQWAVAAPTGISRSLLCEFEKGRKTPTTEIAEKLARALGVPLWVIYPHLGQDGGNRHDAAAPGNP